MKTAPCHRTVFFNGATRFLFAAAALVGAMLVHDAYAQIHKCRHPDGRTSYSEQPCERSGGTAVGQIRTGPARALPEPAGLSPQAAKQTGPTELESSCKKLQLEIDETVHRVRKARLDKTERMAEAAKMQPPLSAQDRMTLERHLDESIGEQRIYLRGLVHSPTTAQCERGGIRLELRSADELKAQPAR